MNIREEVKNVAKALVFITIAILPFISITNMIGLDAFLDSFENPDAYVCLKNSGNIVGLKTQEDNYIIIQKTDHPDFELKQDDKVVYFEINGEMAYDTIYEINGIGPLKRYYTYSSLKNEMNSPVFSTQIIGKVVKIVDNNIWNDLSIQLWEASIDYLNIERAF
jgi:hypothetical protein